jgi:hypothetical protein
MVGWVNSGLGGENLKILDLSSCDTERRQDPSGLLLCILDHD